MKISRYISGGIEVALENKLQPQSNYLVPDSALEVFSINKRKPVLYDDRVTTDLQ